MQDHEKRRLADVYGTTRELPLSYVQRTGVDDIFVNDLSRRKHIVLYGGSKQGKSCLRKHSLMGDDCVVIQCVRETTKEALYTMILKLAGVACEVTESKTISGSHKLRLSVAAEIMASTFAKIMPGMQYTYNRTNETSTQRTEWEIDPGDPNDLSRTLSAIGFHKYIVIEDYHYLSSEVQSQVADDLKVFFEISDLTFIIIGVWREASRLQLHNGDLRGRLTAINTDEWTPAQLLEVIEAGEPLLNINISSETKDAMINACQGNVGLLQEICFGLCEKHDVWQTKEDLITIGSPDEVKQLLQKMTAADNTAYTRFLADLSDGLGKTVHEMYKWIGYVLVTAAPNELRAGIKQNDVYHRIVEKHPNRADLQHNSVNQALRSLASVQHKHNVRPYVLDYSNGAVYVVDPGFLSFVASSTKLMLLEELGFSNPRQLLGE